MDEKERRLEPFNIERTKKNMKEDFDKITTLDDLKDFFLQLLPKMMETDIYSLEKLKTIESHSSIGLSFIDSLVKDVVRLESRIRALEKEVFKDLEKEIEE